MLFGSTFSLGMLFWLTFACCYFSEAIALIYTWILCLFACLYAIDYWCYLDLIWVQFNCSLVLVSEDITKCCYSFGGFRICVSVKQHYDSRFFFLSHFFLFQDTFPFGEAEYLIYDCYYILVGEFCCIYSWFCSLFRALVIINTFLFCFKFILLLNNN